MYTNCKCVQAKWFWSSSTQSPITPQLPVVAFFQTSLQCAGPRGTKYQKPHPQTINKPMGIKFQTQILMF